MIPWFADDLKSLRPGGSDLCTDISIASGCFEQCRCHCGHLTGTGTSRWPPGPKTWTVLELARRQHCCAGHGLTAFPDPAGSANLNTASCHGYAQAGQASPGYRDAGLFSVPGPLGRLGLDQSSFLDKARHWSTRYATTSGFLQ